MGRKIIYGVMAVLVLLVVGLFMLKAPTTTINESAETQYLKEIEKAFVPNEYICDGNFCTVDDDQIYFNCTEVAFQPECTIATKNFNGDADIVFLFNTDEVLPQSLEYNPQVQQVQRSFTCEYNYVINTTSKHLYCYNTITDEVSTYNSSVFNGNYETLNAQTKTVYWTENLTTWTKYNGEYIMERIDFKNNTRKYTLPNISFTAGVERTFKLNLKTIGYVKAHKYWIGIKPSSLTWIEAIAQNKYFVLDPWTPDLNTNIIAYWTFNETGAGDNATDIVDSANRHEGDSTGTATITGLLDGAFNYDAGDFVDLVNSSGLNFTLDTDSFSWQGWMFHDTVDTQKRHPIGTGGGAAPDAWLRSMSNNNLQWLIRDKDSLFVSIQSAAPISAATWYHIALVWDAPNKNSSMWLDGALIGSSVQAGIDGYLLQTGWVFGKAESTTLYDGRTDEWAVFAEALTKAKIVQLYNSGTPIRYTSSAVPVVSILFPLNNTVHSTSIVDLKYAVDAQGDFCWYSADGGSSNSSAVVAGVNFTISTTPQWNNFTIYCNATGGQIGWNETMFFVNKSVGTVLILPLNNNNTRNSYVDFTYNATTLNANLTNTTFSLWFANGTLFYTNFTTLSGTDTVEREVNVSGLLHNNYSWGAETCGIGVPCSSATNRSLIVDTRGPTITIESPAATYAYLNSGESIDLNFTATDQLLDSCLTEYNGANTSRACSSGVKFSTTFPYVFGQDNLTVYANDSLASWNSSVVSWVIQLAEINRTFDAAVTQTAQTTFLYEGGAGAGVNVVSGRLWYNGSAYTPSVTKAGSLFNLTNIIEIPADTAEGVITFFWEIIYTNSTGTNYFNTSTSNQTVGALTLYECSAPTPAGLTLNFTTYDSTNNTELNSTMGATFGFYATSGTGSSTIEYNFQDLNENRSNYLFCLNSSGANVTLDAFISYTATDYDRREYIIDDGIIGNFTQDIPLFLTLTSLTDIVTVTVQDQNYDEIAGALVVIQRWNVGTNTYSTIGMFTTSSTGNGIIDLELYTTWYRAVVYVDGTIVKVTDVEKLSSTSWPINVDLGADNPYDLFGTISHGLTFNNVTNITSFTWLDASGYTQQGCLVINNETSLGPQTIFNTCVVSVSGTIEELIAHNGTYTVYGIIYLDGYNSSQIVDTLLIQLGVSAITATVSPFGKVISFITVGTAGAIGVAAGSAILGGALIIVVLIALLYFGFLNITWGFIWGIISIMILVWIMQRRKR